MTADALAKRPATAGSILKERKRAFAGDDDRRVVGLGYKIDMARVKAAADPITGLGDLIDIVRNSVNCPTWNIPNIEQVRWTVAGPLTNFATTKNFSATIDIFGRPDAEGVDFIESTMAQVGELQTHTLICAIGVHIEPEPLCFTAQGNAWYHPNTAQQQKPPSPNVFSQNDRLNGALGANFAGQNPTQFMVPALLEWGWWANYAAWHMVRGFDLKWSIGQKTTLLDESLRHSAYMPPNAQEGSASSSQVDFADMIARVNARYLSRLGSSADLLKIDFQRLGSALVGGVNGVNVGMFQPSRAFELAGATYGGMDLRSMLKGNSEFRQLTIPYFLHAGVPIGLRMQESDPIQADLMRRMIDVTQGQDGTVPPFITDSANAVGGLVSPTNLGALTLGGGNTSMELPLFPGATPPVGQQIDSSRVLFKGGEFKITMLVKGFEVDEDWYNTLKNNPDLRDAFMCECGCGWAK